MDVFHAMSEMRAMRRLKPDPVPRELVREVIDYAIRAPTGGNAQNWRFVVVTDPAKRAEIGGYYRKAVNTYLERVNTGPLPHQTQDAWERLVRSVRWQGNHLAACPVLIFPCARGKREKMGRTAGSSVYPAVQNLLLACRAKGLGATLTTLHLGYEREIDAILGIPENAATFAMIPVGYPLGKFGPTKRLPVDDVIGWDGWE